MDTMIKAQRAFTLVENMVAMVIFSTGALGYVMMSTVLSQRAGESEVTGQAILITQSIVDDMRRMDYTQLINDGDGQTGRYYSVFGEQVDPDNKETAAFYTVKWLADVMTDTEPERVVVDMTISWADSGFSDPDSEGALDFVDLTFARMAPK